MLQQETIKKKRDGKKLSSEEIKKFISGIVSGKVSEGQVAAFCMAVLLKGMDMEERIALTMAMAQSGTVMDWSGENLPGPVLDKHSTGGVGDKVSLMLAPVVAACGGYVPMISGRGLGHTGGTLDKMDSIPGYVSQPDNQPLVKAVHEAGCAIIGATANLAPADKTVYAIRDVTATVESIDLITASILSKKLAAGLDGLVMDVKFGSGAFMRDEGDAEDLANSIVSVANGAGMPTVALMTDMNQVLGRTAGNAVEVAEAVAFLRNENVDERLKEVTLSLCAELLLLGKLAETPDAARQKVEQALSSGKAAEHFARMVTCLGGKADFMDTYVDTLPKAPVVRDYYPDEAGIVNKMDTRAIGIGIVELGGGRTKPSDSVDHSVGLTNIAALGETVGQGARPLATIHARDEEAWQQMAKGLSQAVTLADEKPQVTDLIKKRITP